MGAYWGRSRKYRAAPQLASSGVCTRCGEGEDTDLHRFWTCKANQDINLPEVQRTQSLVGRAEAEGTNWACFWCRGIVPEEWLKIKQPISEEQIFYTKGEAGPSKSHIICTDGSGGVHSSDKTLRRCGWAYVFVHEEEGRPTAGWAAYGPLPHQHQSVRRAEAWAVLQAIKEIGTGGRATIFSDNQGCVDNFAGSFPVRSANQDVWDSIKEELQRRQLRVRLVKVAGHLDDPMAAWGSRAPAVAVFGNIIADKLAGRGARLGQVTEGEEKQVNKVRTLARKVLLRLAFVGREAAQKEGKQDKVLKVRDKVRKGARLRAAMASTTHRLVMAGGSSGKLRCTRCQGIPKKGSMATWLGKECPGHKGEGQQGTPHYTHKLARQGVWLFCRTCGAFTSGKRQQQLLKPCHGKPTSLLAKVSLGRLAKQLDPVTQDAKANLGMVLEVLDQEEGKEEEGWVRIPPSIRKEERALVQAAEEREEARSPRLLACSEAGQDGEQVRVEEEEDPLGLGFSLG